jgi:hypothetical protein
MTTGRNFDLGFVAVTQRAALTDTSVFELSFQRYFSRMDGENDTKKVSKYIGKENARQLQNLRLGEFFYDFGTETKLIKTEEFRSKTKPSRVQVKTQIAQKEPDQPGDYAQEPPIFGFILLGVGMVAIALFTFAIAAALAAL